MSPFDIFRVFDDALDWDYDEDPLLESEPALAPWPAEDAALDT